MVLNFEDYGNRGIRFLKKLARDMKVSKEPGYPERLMTAFLYVLRDMRSFEESLRIISILPMHFKGIYAHGWKLNSTPTNSASLDEFISALREKYSKSSGKKLGDDLLVKEHIKCILTLLSLDASRSRIEQDVKQAIPAILHELLEPEEVTLSDNGQEQFQKPRPETD